MAARRGQSARAAAGARAQRNKRGSPWGGPRLAALKPLLWGVLLVGALYFLGKWAGDAQPAGGEPALPAGDDRSGVSNPAEEGPDAVGSGQGAAAQPAPEPPAPAEQSDADGSGEANEPADVSDSQPEPPAGEIPAELAAARTHIDRSGGRTPTRAVPIYFVDTARDTTLQPVEVLLPASKTPVADVVAQWLRPPEDLRLTSGVPAGAKTVVGGINLRDGTVVVNVTPDLYSGGGTAWANSVVYTLVYSLTEVKGVEKVQLKVNGHPAELEGWVWSKPIGRDELPGGTAFRIAPLIRYRG